jgi:CheY-like chemotaxis protein/predicted regulator of Ras-like GTPase activity (Roadblock/LC7/MglB family)
LLYISSLINGELDMKYVLVVDDEESLLLTIQAGFDSYKDSFEVVTAHNGKEAVAVLESLPISLVVTDLKMPEMDGFELLTYLKNDYPQIPAIVMTAFGTPAIESRLSQTGMMRMLEKPVDFEELTQLIVSLLDQDFTGGTLTGISLPSFLQLIEMEQNTCLMEIMTPMGQGLLYFNKGVLYDAILGDAKAEEAALTMLAMDDVKISFRNLPSKKLKKRIKKNIMTLIMEGAKLKDEMADLAGTGGKPPPDEEYGADVMEAEAPSIPAHQNNELIKGEAKMADMKEILEKFKIVDGFQAVGAFSPNGELVAECNTNGKNLAEMGALANDVLLKAQKTTDIMEVGRGQLVHVEAPKAHVICRCLNESTDFAASTAGRAHVHMVLILEKDGNVAMGKMKISSVIQEIAEFFR